MDTIDVSFYTEYSMSGKSWCRIGGYVTDYKGTVFINDLIHSTSRY